MTPQDGAPNHRICFVGTCGKPDINAPDEGTWPTCSKYPPACVEHIGFVPPPQRKAPPASPAPGAPTKGHHYGAPLDVAVEDGALVIRIGVQVLAHAVTYSEWAHDYEDEAGDYFRTFAITDAPTFADDVKHAMLSEREDGSSPLSDFLDKMTQAAVEDGSPATEDARIKHGETDPRETWAKDMR